MTIHVLIGFVYIVLCDHDKGTHDPGSVPQHKHISDHEGCNIERPDARNSVPRSRIVDPDAWRSPLA